MHPATPLLSRASRTAAAPLAIVAIALAATACDQEPTAIGPAEAVTSNAPANGAFPTWHQGFNQGHLGWYGAEQSGDLGWCGEIRAVQGPQSDPAPSAGRGYALVAQGECNSFWDNLYSAPGAQLVGVPWAPGPEFSAMFEPMPPSGFVRELDIYLDPTWEASPLEPGTWVFELDPQGSGDLFGYSVTFATSGPPAPVFHYIRVPVTSGSGALYVGQAGHEVDEAGWYTFRHLFGDEGGQLTVDFELRTASGELVGHESVDALYFSGLAPEAFATSQVLTGYTWFTSISPGLEVPIDEHRVRPGR